MIRVERRLGVASGEPLFTCLCLADLRENSYVTVERWDSFGVRVRDWQQAVAQAAERRMDLSIPERPPTRPLDSGGTLFRLTSSRPVPDEVARTRYGPDR
jgi:hypothetical protein